MKYPQADHVSIAELMLLGTLLVLFAGTVGLGVGFVVFVVIRVLNH